MQSNRTLIVSRLESYFGAPAGTRVHLISLAGDGKSNIRIRQCEHWLMHTPPACADMIRVPAGHQKRDRTSGLFFGAPAGTRTPDTLLKRQVLYLLSYWGMSSEQASDRPASAQARKLAPSAAPPLKTEPAALGFGFGKRGNVERLSPNRIRGIRFGKEEGERPSAVFAMLRGNGANRASPDAVAGMAGLEPTISESKSGVLPLHYIPS